MVILKKIKASTLMETLVASVLIVVIFMIASMILNNLFSNTIKANNRAIESHINELHYLYHNKRLEIPYYDQFKTWDITISSFQEKNNKMVQFEAINTLNQQHYSKQIIENQ